MSSPSAIALPRSTSHTLGMPAFFHEKLSVYAKALDLAAAADAIAIQLPRERFSLRDQLWRCSLSVPLNIAEGAAARTLKTRLNYFAIANGSAAECSAIFDCIVRFRLFTAAEMPYQEVREDGAILAATLRRKP